MNLAEYLKYQAPAGFRDQLLKGEVVLSPSASWKHSKICTRLVALLSAIVDSAKFEVLIDTAMLIEPEDAPRPDVYVIRRDRLPENEPFPTGAPEIAIEVLSPSNTPDEIENKRVLYLENGSLAVWIVDPKTRTVEVFTNSSHHLAERFIDLPGDISMLTIEVAAIFR